MGFFLPEKSADCSFMLWIWLYRGQSCDALANVKISPEIACHLVGLIKMKDEALKDFYFYLVDGVSNEKNIFEWGKGVEGDMDFYSQLRILEFWLSVPFGF